VQDVTEGSPGERAGLRPYDLITAVDGRAVSTNDELIRRISSMSPGNPVRLDLVRDGRSVALTVKLAERPGNPLQSRRTGPAQPSSNSTPAEPPLGLSVRDLDRDDVTRLALRSRQQGVVIARVDPLSAAFDADLGARPGDSRSEPQACGLRRRLPTARGERPRRRRLDVVRLSPGCSRAAAASCAPSAWTPR
jgi:serine protease Do